MTNSLINGRRGKQVPVSDRGLNYGDGIFRSMLVWDAQIQALAEHLSIIERDLRQIGLLKIGVPRPAFSQLESALLNEAKKQGHGVLKLVITAGDSARGYARVEGPLRWIISCSNLPHWPASHWQQGIAACELDFHWAAQPALAGVKHLNRLEQVLARQMLPDDFQEASIGDVQGHLVSGIMSNVFWSDAGVWHTPALSSSGVAGCMRGRVIAALAALSMDVREVSNAPTAGLAQADLVLFCNAVIGLWPVRRWQALDGSLCNWSSQQIATHQAFQALCRSIHHPWQGQHV